MAPNFFLAAKGPDGSLAVAGQQALYDAALGERGQISLESWGQDGTVFDNKAHTITSIYHGGQLKLYSMHAAPSNNPDNRPQYYMHQLHAYAMTGDADTFRKGAAAFRNLRDYAEEQRNGAIQRANERAETTAIDEVVDVEFEDIQTGSSDAAYSGARGISNSISGAPIGEQESETSMDELQATPPAKWAALQARRNRRRKVQTNEIE
ncbi:hypothetical protein MMC25_006574 [Agyrium rufum]|nr:hypothetical protein [Agyrium rufum]